MTVPRRETAIKRRIKPKYESRNHEIVAGLRDAAEAGPPVDPRMKIKRLMAEVAVLAALIHGGDWRVEHQPKKGFLLVSRRRERSR